MPESQVETSRAPSPAPVNVSTTADTSGRVVSVDALRGFDMFWIIGADALVNALHGIAKNNPVITPIANQLEHVDWAGFHFYDLIFPLFVFIVGVSIVFALSRRVAAAGRGPAAMQVVRRFVILYLLGLFAYGGISKGYEEIRLLGVLQRIAICYLCAGLAFLYLKPRGLVILCASLLIGYWAVMSFVPVPGIGAGNFEEGKNLANWIDFNYLPLRKWDKTHDPEGLLSTLPAIATALLGVFAGMLLTRKDVEPGTKVKWLLIAGVCSLAAGFLWSFQFPIIKKIWTSSFVLVAGGWSAILLAVFYHVVDVKKWQGWCAPFLWIGANAITIYMLVHIVSMGSMANRLIGGEIRGAFDLITPGLGELLNACIALLLGILVCRFLYKRKIFIKV